MKMSCKKMYTVPAGQHRTVADNGKYFLAFNSTSIFKCLECAHLPLGIGRSHLIPVSSFSLSMPPITPHSYAMGMCVCVCGVWCGV